MAGILGGTFRMGSDRHYPEVRVDGPWMDVHTVTNEEFRRFVDALDQRQAGEVVAYRRLTYWRTQIVAVTSPSSSRIRQPSGDPWGNRQRAASRAAFASRAASCTDASSAVKRSITRELFGSRPDSSSMAKIILPPQ